MLDRWRQLVAYYLDCVRDDAGVTARALLADVGTHWLPLSDGPAPPLSAEWETSSQGRLSLPLRDDVNRMVSALRQGRSSTDLYYGFPCWIGSGQEGTDGAVRTIEPLFLLDVVHRPDGGDWNLELADGWVRWNSDLVYRLAPTAEERRQLLEDLGLLEVDGEPVPIAELVARMQPLVDAQTIVEPLDPHRLAHAPPTNAVHRTGWYNRAILVIGDRPGFTQGLYAELERLRDAMTPELLAQSALGPLLGAELPASAATEPAVVEVVPLDTDQRAAVAAALCNKLSVVTGPPGTGKSQVVVAVLANAWLHGQTVLFASRNHKAVDVVEERTRALVGQPLAVRAGKQAGARNLRQVLLQFLDGILSLVATAADRLELDEARGECEKLLADRAAIWVQVDALQRAHQQRVPNDAVGHVDHPLTVEARALSDQLLAPTPTGLSGLAARWSAREIRARWLAILEALAEVSGGDAGDVASLSPSTAHVWIATCQSRINTAADQQAVATAQAALEHLPRLETLAMTLAQLDRKMLPAGLRMLSARLRTLSDALVGRRRQALGAYRATIERLDQGTLGRKAYAQLAQQLDQLFSSIVQILPVWCVTNLSARGSLPLSMALFDLVVIDESSQCDIASALPLLARAKRAMVIGDPQQLRHVASIDPQRDTYLQLRHGLLDVYAQPYTFSISSFYDLCSNFVGQGGLHTLRHHFRSHPAVIAFSNRTYYGDRLLVCTDVEALRVPERLGGGVVWQDVRGPMRRPTSGGCISQAEVDAAVALVKQLLLVDEFQGTLGVVTPFRAQANAIRERLVRELDPAIVEQADLVVETAHGLQGDERDVVVLSPCVGPQMPDGSRRFLAQTGHLFNVAVTRARGLLLVVGDKEACARSGIPHLQAFARAADRPVQPTDSQGPHSELAGPWERVLFEGLAAAGMRPMAQFAITPHRVDLAVVDGAARVAIEVDGEAWHRRADGQRLRQDVLRDMQLASRGWTVVRFWVREIRDDLPGCVARVRRALGAPCGAHEHAA
ncbi:MAG: AAA family ATPase [Deltaproteobacteria bacterium]|nr:AAA family ATPase [Deltaproteobacteria bacterium]